MNDNDLVMRGVIKERMIARGWKHPDSTVTEFVEDDIPAVPQEMSAREFAKAFRRMCDSYDVNGHNSCEGCEVWRKNICCLCDLPDIIPIVEKWAREHPEGRSEE